MPAKIRISRKNLALAQSSAVIIGRGWQSERIGAEAMALSILDLVLWICGIRGHIPRDGAFGGGPHRSSLVGTHSLMRLLAGAVIAVAFLSLAIWAAVWLAIKLL
jgi:hypothetical protein